MAYAWFQHTPSGFADTANIFLSVEGNLLPAHRQILASQSRMFHTMLQALDDDPGNITTRTAPEKCSLPACFSLQDVEAFLCQIYSFCSNAPQSMQEAYEVSRLADSFDSPKLMKICMDYLMAQPDRMFKATAEADGVLKWMLLAEKFGLDELQQQAICFIVKYGFDVRDDARLEELSSSSLLQLVKANQALRAASRLSPQCSCKEGSTLAFCSAERCPCHAWHREGQCSLADPSSNAADCNGKVLEVIPPVWQRRRSGMFLNNFYICLMVWLGLFMGDHYGYHWHSWTI